MPGRGGHRRDASLLVWNKKSAADSVDPEAWLAEFEVAFAQVAGRFARRDTRAVGRDLLSGLVAPLERKNCWTIARTGTNPGQTLEDYIGGLGERWARSIDRTSTYDPYAAGLKLRVIPELGHIPVGMITAGLIDRAIDRWESSAGHSTVKNTVAALVHVLDDAVRDGLLPRNPAKDRARRKQPGQVKDGSDVNPRDLALPDVATLDKLAAAAKEAGGHKCWGDMVLLLATTGMRISEVSGLVVGDVDLKAGTPTTGH